MYPRVRVHNLPALCCPAGDTTHAESGPNVTTSLDRQRSDARQREIGQLYRTVLVMLILLIAGGAAAIYIWSSINEILKGEASLVEILITAAAIALLGGAVYFLQRYTTNIEDSR